MNRIASIVVLVLIAATASAQFNDQRITATIPFEFAVGKNTMPAGQYVFLRTGANTLLIRNQQGRGLATVVTRPVQPTGGPSHTKLRFANIAGRQVLVQVWNDHDGIGNELYNANTLIEEAGYPAVHGNSAGRR
jgi:hypothetical protein